MAPTDSNAPDAAWERTLMGSVLGWTRVRVAARAERPCIARLHLDVGKGFTPATAYPLGRIDRTRTELARPLWLPPQAAALRVAPLAPGDRLVVEEVTLEPLRDEDGLAEALAMLDAWMPWMGTRVRSLTEEARAAWSRGDVTTMVAALAEAIRRTDAACTDPYRHWLRHRQAEPGALSAEAEQLLATWPEAPLFSVLLPVHDPPAAYLEAAIDSVRAQAYPRWELRIVDDASTRPHVAEVLARHRAADPRIHVERTERNGGISAATNRALATAAGAFAALLDHDDVLAPGALLAMARALRGQPQARMLYSDEDKLDPDGARCDPFFKPDWSPSYFLSCMYTCHLGVYAIDRLRAIGGFRPEHDGAQDYDLVLRFTEDGGQVVHVPEVLYSWRMHAASTAASAESKPYAHFAAEAAIRERLARDGADAWLESSPSPGFHSVRHRVRGRPLVSVLLATSGGTRFAGGRQLDVTANAVERLLARTAWRPLEVLVIEIPRPGTTTSSVGGEREGSGLPSHRSTGAFPGRNPSSLASDFPTSSAMDGAVSAFPEGVRAVSVPGATLAERIDAAARTAAGELLVLLHDDVEPCEPSWLERLVEHGQLDAVGAVSGKLLLPSDRVESAGLLLAAGRPHPAHRGVPADDRGYYLSTIVPRNVSAVSGACLLTRKALFLESGGLDPALGPLADTDYCLRLAARGLRCLVLPGAEVYHAGCSPLDEEPSEAEVHRLRERWGDRVDRDPFYNPNLTQQPPFWRIAL